MTADERFTWNDRRDLGRLVGELERLIGISHELAADIDRFGGPSECHAAAFEPTRRELLAFFEGLETTADGFIAEVKARTSARWVHFRGLDEAAAICDDGRRGDHR